jgi:hypothetical protein
LLYRTDFSVERQTALDSIDKDELPLTRSPDELQLETDKLPLEIRDGPSSDRQATDVGTPPRKRNKTTAFKGSARYSTKFDRSWSRKYDCIDALREDPFCFFRTVCKKKRKKKSILQTPRGIRYKKAHSKHISRKFCAAVSKATEAGIL